LHGVNNIRHKGHAAPLLSLGLLHVRFHTLLGSVQLWDLQLWALQPSELQTPDHDAETLGELRMGCRQNLVERCLTRPCDELLAHCACSSPVRRCGRLQLLHHRII